MRLLESWQLFLKDLTMIRKKKKNFTNGRQPNFKEIALSHLKAKYPNYNLKSNILGGLFFGGLVLSIWEVTIFRETFIPLYIPLSIWVSIGLVITPFFKRIFNIYCFNPYTPERTPIVFHCLYNIVSFGSIVVFLFMWTNQTFVDKSKTNFKLPIISYGHFAITRHSHGEPWVHVVYKNSEKELVFPIGTKVEKFKSVNIETQKGLFGFNIITDQNLMELR